VYPCGHVPVSASPAAPPRGRPPGRNSFIPLCLDARTGHAHAPSPTTTAPPASFFLSLRTPHPLACFSSPSSLALLCLTAQHPRLYKRAPPCCSPTQTRTHGLSPPALFQSSSLSLSLSLRPSLRTQRQVIKNPPDAESRPAQLRLHTPAPLVGSHGEIRLHFGAVLGPGGAQLRAVP
jgi:hypothetical protein